MQVSGAEKREVDTALRHLEELIERVDRLEDPAAREPSRELVQVILDLHGVALAQLVSIVARADGGSTILARLAADERVCPILLLHGLHPDGLETRVRRAAERLTPHLGVHGLRLEVSEITRGTARLRVFPSGGSPVKATLLWSLPGEITAAIIEAAPDIEEVLIDGLDMPTQIPGAMTSNAAQ